MAEHYLDDSTIHDVWDNSLTPRIEIAPGDTVTFECRDAGNHHVKFDSTQPAPIINVSLSSRYCYY